jgi:hypothetical protein
MTALVGITIRNRPTEKLCRLQPGQAPAHDREHAQAML